MQEICSALDLNRTSAYHIISTMCSEGFVMRNPKSKNYSPGLEIFHLSQFNKDAIASNFFKAAEETLEEIVAEIDETTCIYIRKNFHAYCVDGKEGSKRIKASLNMGETIPLHATATGKVILAHLSEDELTEYLALEGLKRYQKKTIADEASLKKALAEVEKQGYATEFEEYEELINAVAVPLMLKGRANAVLVVVGPVLSLNENNIVQVAQLLIRKVEDIQSLLNLKPGE